MMNRGMEQIHGFLAARNMDISCLGQYVEMNGCRQYHNLLCKFPGDQVLLEEEGQVSFLDGYVHNKKEIIEDSGKEDWPHAFADAMRREPEQCLQELRGGFCGYVYHDKECRLLAYTDQTSVKALYYYVEGERWMVSDCLAYMTAVLRENAVKYDLNDTAVKYMMTYGYMLDGSTFVRQIRRLLPGQIVSIAGGTADVRRYYTICDQEVKMSEQEAVEKVDAAFREAVRREFEKDREYGYRHLVDLSGGLDSRMVCWVAHDLGYTDQLNVAYSKSGYLDDKISRRIAGDLKHEYLFKPLDDLKWMYDLEQIIKKNNGAALYSGITGGARLLGMLNMEQFGIEHTGMIGDAVLSTFYHDKNFNYGKPRLGLHRYSERLDYEFEDTVLEGYSCQEMFAIYTRGILGAQSSYRIRQHYVETASPFMDVDFLDTVFSIPFDYRNGHHLYLMWIKEKYPGAARYGWEKWGGVKPMESHIFLRKMKTIQRLLWQMMCNVMKIKNRDSMNPLDAWYLEDKEVQEFCESYYAEHIGQAVLSESIRKDIAAMFQQGNVTEKSMALTVLAAAELYFEQK